jgi:hypothetical protein
MKRDDNFFKRVRGFLTVFLPKNKCYSNHTVKAYRDTINLFRKFLLEEKAISFIDINFEQIHHEVIYEFLAWLQNTRGCAATTKNCADGYLSGHSNGAIPKGGQEQSGIYVGNSFEDSAGATRPS